MRNLLVIMLILLVASQSCTNKSGEKQIEDGPDKFTWNIQRAGYEYSKCDQMGVISRKEFIKEYNTYPWIDEIEKANQYSDRCSPTLTVVDEKLKKDFWISMAGDRNDYGFYLGYIFVNSNNQRWCEMYTTQSNVVVDDLIDFFFDRNYDEFEALIETLDFEGGTESEDIAK